MYITVKEAIELTGKPERTIYRYIESGKLRKDPDSNKIMVSIEDCYKIREENCRNEK